MLTVRLKALLSINTMDSIISARYPKLLNFANYTPQPAFPIPNYTRLKRGIPNEVARC